ncbi:hypothetical protein ACHAXR_008192 [Thalassiosira sp. AJA248-18]
MALTLEQLTLVQSSWAKVVPTAGTAADLFYSKLLKLDLRFNHDSAELSNKVSPTPHAPVVSKMALTLEQLTLVQSSWAKVVPTAGTAADLFYSKLLKLDPELRPLLDTLEKGLGESWDDAHNEVWTLVYAVCLEQDNAIDGGGGEKEKEKEKETISTTG